LGGGGISFAILGYFAHEILKAQNSGMGSFTLPVGERIIDEILVKDGFYDVA
jgi:hypothetical protein